MKNKIEKIMAAVMLAVVSLTSIAINIDIKSVQASKKSEAKKCKYTVVIDAGHGGYDPGKIGVHSEKEKDINLEIAIKLQKYLEQNKICVIMTRTEDVSLCDESGSGSKKASDMKKRVEIVNASNADLCISIHQNSYNASEVKGAQVFYYSKSEEGKNFAEILQSVLKSDVDNSNNRKAKANDNYYMLLKVNCPAVIVECGFLSNWEEATSLKDEFYQDKIAQAINKAVIECLSNI